DDSEHNHGRAEGARAHSLADLPEHYCCDRLVFQMSRCSFHSPWISFQMTMYLPRSINCPAPSRNVYWPISIAVLPCASTSRVSSFTSLMPMPRTASQKSAI